MKTIKPLLLLSLILLLSNYVKAQDQMFLRGVKEPVPVKVYEIGLDEIKYKPWSDTSMPVLVMPRENVKKLIISGGSSFEFSENPMAESSNYSQQHNQAVKIHFLSPLYGNTAFTYERSFKPGRSYELGLSVIGLGLTEGFDHLSGVYLRGGYKFISTPDFYLKGMRYAHILKGGYVKPELIIGAYGYDTEASRTVFDPASFTYVTRTIDYRSHVTFGAVMINLGKQWVFDDKLLFDIYFGMGYGFTSVSESKYIPDGFTKDELTGFNFAFVGGVKEFPLAFSIGLKTGFLFGKPAQAKDK